MQRQIKCLLANINVKLSDNFLKGQLIIAIYPAKYVKMYIWNNGSTAGTMDGQSRVDPRWS